MSSKKVGLPEAQRIETRSKVSLCAELCRYWINLWRLEDRATYFKGINET